MAKVKRRPNRELPASGSPVSRMLPPGTAVQATRDFIGITPSNAPWGPGVPSAYEIKGDTQGLVEGDEFGLLIVVFEQAGNETVRVTAPHYVLKHG
jgi:hypothetical protein